MKLTLVERRRQQGSRHAVRGSVAGAAVLGIALGAGTVASLAACDSSRSRTDEAIEEIQDEVDDATEKVREEAEEARENIEDEIDDHS